MAQRGGCKSKEDAEVARPAARGSRHICSPGCETTRGGGGGCAAGGGFVLGSGGGLVASSGGRGSR